MLSGQTIMSVLSWYPLAALFWRGLLLEGPVFDDEVLATLFWRWFLLEGPMVGGELSVAVVASLTLWCLVLGGQGMEAEHRGG